MALEKLNLDGTENGGTAGEKINLAIDEVNGIGTGIADNATNIAQNTSDITQNTTDIGTNTTNIATNRTDIDQNTSDIADLDTEQNNQRNRLNGAEATIATGWKDDMVNLSSALGNGTTDPVWQNMGNGMYAHNFTAGDEIYVEHKADHDYLPLSDAYPHIHWLSDAIMGSGDQTVWEFTYVQAKGYHQGESLTVAPSSFTITYTADGTEIAGEHLVLECSDAQAFALAEVDAIIMGKWKLVSTTTAGNIYGIMSGLHYQADKLATLNKEPDFYEEVV